jgi:hypothetical protein
VQAALLLLAAPGGQPGEKLAEGAALQVQAFVALLLLLLPRGVLAPTLLLHRLLRHLLLLLLRLLVCLPAPWVLHGQVLLGAEVHLGQQLHVWGVPRLLLASRHHQQLPTSCGRCPRRCRQVVVVHQLLSLLHCRWQC